MKPQLQHFGIFIMNFQQLLYIVLVSFLLTLNMIYLEIVEY